MKALRVVCFAVTLCAGHAGLAQPPAPAAHSHENISPAAQSAAGAEVLKFERDLAAALVRGDVAYYEQALAPDFVMIHGDDWTHGDPPRLADDRTSFMKRVSGKIYDAVDIDVQAVEMHGDVAVTYGHYVGNIPGSPEGRRWFGVWYEKVYAKRDGRWVYLSHRTVDGAHYGNDRASVSLKTGGTK
jgi:hypothetical protein